MAILNDTKIILRITNTAYDNEINDLIEACKSDLVLSGVDATKVIDTDPLIKRAIALYCKANFGFGNTEADRYQLSYDLLKQHLRLAGDYNAV